MRLIVCTSMALVAIGISGCTGTVASVVTQTVTTSASSSDALAPESGSGEDVNGIFEQLAYEDCLAGAETDWMSFGADPDTYWMMFDQAWTISSPMDYPKNDATYAACRQAYDDYLRSR